MLISFNMYSQTSQIFYYFISYKLNTRSYSYILKDFVNFPNEYTDNGSFGCFLSQKMPWDSRVQNDAREAHKGAICMCKLSKNKPRCPPINLNTLVDF